MKTTLRHTELFYAGTRLRLTASPTAQQTILFYTIMISLLSDETIFTILIRNIHETRAY